MNWERCLDETALGPPTSTLTRTQARRVFLHETGLVDGSQESVRPPIDQPVAHGPQAPPAVEPSAWLGDESASLHVQSMEDLSTALARGMPSERLMVSYDPDHPALTHLAVSLGAARVVLDRALELHRLSSWVPAGLRQPVLLSISTGLGAASSLGSTAGKSPARYLSSILDGSAEYTAGRILSEPRLRLIGLHCRLDSLSAVSTSHYEWVVRQLAGQVARIHRRFNLELDEIVVSASINLLHQPPGQPRSRPQIGLNSGPRAIRGPAGESSSRDHQGP